MKKTVFTLLFGLLFQVHAQTLRGDFDLANYPEISFVWNEYNPDVKDSAQFALASGNGKIPFRLHRLPRNEAHPKAKSILFLWEDLDHNQHEGQSEFTRTVLYNFLKGAAINADDQFNVGVFDRKGGNDAGSSIHTLLSSGFTSDCHQLAEAVRNFKPKYDFYSGQINSELYIAIEEGIALLEKEPSDRVRAIVVFTAGSNQDSYGGRNGIDENRAIARKIPVYAVKYPIHGCEHCTNIDLICRATFGLETITGDATLALQQLKEYHAGISERHYGQDYSIAFTSPFPRDGKQHSIVLDVNGKEYPLSFIAPSFSLKLWINENLLWIVPAVAILLIVIVLTVIMACCKAKRHRMKLLALEEKQLRTQQEADASRRTLDDFRRQETEKEHAAKEKEQMERLTKFMQTKNLFPRLQYSVNGQKKTCTIHKVETTLGRDGDNDIVLPSDSVSRHHARIIFTGPGFEIHDLGSTNRVIVNGAFAERTLLSNNDRIGLGEITIHFFI
jgi:hypothetical protein